MKKYLSAAIAVTVLLQMMGSGTALAWTTSRTEPADITDTDYMFPAFSNGEVLLGKKTGRLPAMGWNSWNAFGSGNTEELTKAMADAFVDLGLDKLGYEYIVLDDGCYKSERVDGKLSNDTVKFPSGFKALSDYIHNKGLKFGMYNDIGTNLCAGAAVGTAGHEDVDAQTYIDWGVDFLKVDNCYYLWDNATFSGEDKAKYTYAPNIRSITVNGNGLDVTLNAVKDGALLGQGAQKNTSGDYVTNIGTFDGTNTGTTPVGDRWGELKFTVTAPAEGDYTMTVSYASAEKTGVGRWLQAAVGEADSETRYMDELLPLTASETSFTDTEPVTIHLNEGENTIRLMNHRRQENVLQSYAALYDSLNKADPDHDVLLSICEWGKTQPQNWGYKVGSSWRILNDITFNVGNTSGSAGSASWNNAGTASIASQYNKAVIMDEFSGLDKGWNDPDMMVIGMNGITTDMSRTHFTMWSMMNAPLMLGMDLRRVTKGDEIYNIIANEKVIALNQDSLGVQAKRIYSTKAKSSPDTEYITDNDRVDVLAKPLSNGDIALSFINLSTSDSNTTVSVDKELISNYIGSKMAEGNSFADAAAYYVEDLWSGETQIITGGEFSVDTLKAYDNVTIRVTPLTDAASLQSVLKSEIDTANALLASKAEYESMTLFAAANGELSAVIADAQTKMSSEDAEVLKDAVMALKSAEESLNSVYELYDELGALIEKSDAVISDPEKYVQDDAWSIFTAATEKAKAVYKDPKTEQEIRDVMSEVSAARQSLRRNLADGFDPAAWYIFDDVSDGEIEDVSGNGNTAKLVNSGAKIENGALSLNRSNENNGYLELPSDILSEAENFAVTAWVKLDEYRAWARLFDFGVSDTEGYMFLCPSNQSSKTVYAITKTTSSGEKSMNTDRPELNTWVHMAVIGSGDKTAMYINGEKTGEISAGITPSQILSENARYYIGKSQYNDPYLKGSIKDLRIYDKALTNDELQTIVNGLDLGIKSVSPVSVRTDQGIAPVLPSSVNVELVDGSQTKAAVEWDAVSEAAICLGEPFTVYGTIQGTALKAEANVTFTTMSVHEGYNANIYTSNDAVNAVVANKGEGSAEATVYFVSFDESGDITGLKAENAALEPGGYKRASAELPADGSVKVYVWDKQQTPITAVQEITPEQPYWTVVRPNAELTEVDPVSGVTIITESGDLWGKADGAGSAKNIYLTEVPESMRDSFTIEVAVSFKPDEDYQRAALIVYGGDGNQVSVMRRYHSSYDGNVFMTVMNTDGKAGAEDQYTADTYGDECLLRLEKNGTEFKGYFSVDGGTSWTQLKTLAQSKIDGYESIKVGFYASNGDEEADSAPVTFRDFKLNGKTISFEDVR